MRKTGQELYNEARRLCSGRSVKGAESGLNAKSGKLRDALTVTEEMTPNGLQLNLGFDEQKAPHAKFVIKGTRFIKPHPVLETAAANLGHETE